MSMAPTDMQLAGEPEDAYEVTIEEAIQYAADVSGHLEYILTYKVYPGVAS